MRSSLALAAASIALVGCAGAPTEEAAPPPAEQIGFENRAAAERFLADALAHRKPATVAPVPQGFRLRAVAEAGIELALPRRWAALRPPDARRPGVLRMFGGLSAELGPAIAALATPESPLKLFAFDPRFERGFATSVSVVGAQIDPGMPYATWSADVVAHVRELPSLRGTVVSSAVGLPFGKALRLEYAKRSGRRIVATVQYVVVSGDRETIVTLTTLPRLKPRYEPLFEAALRTLRPLT